MDTEFEPESAIEKSRFLNKKDEAFSFLCLSISDDLVFHLTDLKTLKEIWDKLESLYGNHDDMRVYQLENELMSLQPSNFETLNDFFTKFKNIVFLLKQCKVEKEYDQLILDILSKSGLIIQFLFLHSVLGISQHPDGRCLHSMPSLSP